MTDNGVPGVFASPETVRQRDDAGGARPDEYEAVEQKRPLAVIY